MSQEVYGNDYEHGEESLFVSEDSETYQPSPSPVMQPPHDNETMDEDQQLPMPPLQPSSTAADELWDPYSGELGPTPQKSVLGVGHELHVRREPLSDPEVTDDTESRINSPPPIDDENDYVLDDNGYSDHGEPLEESLFVSDDDDDNKDQHVFNDTDTPTLDDPEDPSLDVLPIPGFMYGSGTVVHNSDARAMLQHLRNNTENSPRNRQLRHWRLRRNIPAVRWPPVVTHSTSTPHVPAITPTRQTPKKGGTARWRPEEDFLALLVVKSDLEEDQGTSMEGVKQAYDSVKLSFTPDRSNGTIHQAATDPSRAEGRLQLTVNGQWMIDRAIDGSTGGFRRALQLARAWHARCQMYTASTRDLSLDQIARMRLRPLRAATDTAHYAEQQTADLQGQEGVTTVESWGRDLSGLKLFGEGYGGIDNSPEAVERRKKIPSKYALLLMREMIEKRGWTEREVMLAFAHARIRPDGTITWVRGG